jgi:phospholipase A1/A2
LSVFINAYQPYARNLSFYKPMYFLLGLDPEETKFQISFKYRFFNPEQPFAQKHPWIRNFFFGYTQTSFWDLDTDSRPFEDTSYKPELFFQSMNIDTGISWIRGLFVQTGFEHESNGNSGDRSRSTNYIYLEPSIIFLKRAELIGLRIAPRFWAYVNNSDRTNPDLYAYRGYYSLRMTFGQANSIICDTELGFAEKGSSVQVDLTYPLHRLLRGNFDFYLHLQYVNALGESLLNYTDRTEGVRIGLAIVR